LQEELLLEALIELRLLARRRREAADLHGVHVPDGPGGLEEARAGLAATKLAVE
jgi:hypothetical protein|tara:strand:- start:291 stop:452 length:162 start_codon:yes stop_codon:yes gene_type:complete